MTLEMDNTNMFPVGYAFKLRITYGIKYLVPNVPQETKNIIYIRSQILSVNAIYAPHEGHPNQVHSIIPTPTRCTLMYEPLGSSLLVS